MPDGQPEPIADTGRGCGPGRGPSGTAGSQRVGIAGVVLSPRAAASSGSPARCSPDAGVRRCQMMLARTSSAAEVVSSTGQTLYQTTGVRAPVNAVSAASNPATTRYTAMVTGDPAPPVTVAATTATASPHIVNASASHSWRTTRRLSTVTGSKPARTWRVGIACATPQRPTRPAAT